MCLGELNTGLWSTQTALVAPALRRLLAHCVMSCPILRLHAAVCTVSRLPAVSGTDNQKRAPALQQA
jgi:hypothetical protein